MKLCEHLAPLYQNEMRHHNRPLFVSTPHYVDPAASAKIYVNMENKLQSYKADGIQSGIITDYHFPAERYYVCVACRQYLSGPVEDDQREKFAHSQFDLPNDKIIATKDNIYIEDGFFAKFIVPVEKN